MAFYITEQNFRGGEHECDEFQIFDSRKQAEAWLTHHIGAHLYGPFLTLWAAQMHIADASSLHKLLPEELDVSAIDGYMRNVSEAQGL